MKDSELSVSLYTIYTIYNSVNISDCCQFEIMKIPYKWLQSLKKNVEGEIC